MARKRTSTTVQFNEDYLNQIIVKSGSTRAEFSEHLGKSDNYISDCCRVGRISISVALLICKLYDADYDKLTYFTPAQEEKPKEDVRTDDLIVKLLENMVEKNLYLYNEIEKLKAEVTNIKQQLGIEDC